jgi:uncharacterized protein (TIGR00369 family)
VDYSDENVEHILRHVAMARGFNAWLNLQLIAAGDGKCAISLDVTEDMRQHHGFAHGGIVGTLADIATSWAAASTAGDVVTANYSLQLMGPANENRLVAEGEVIKRGPRNVSAQCKVFTLDEAERKKLIAVSLASLAVVPGKG